MSELVERGNREKQGNGELPEGWVIVRIRELLDIEYGDGLTESERDQTGDIPVYGSSGIVGNHSQALIDGPCIIVGRKGSAGDVHYSSGSCWPIDTTYYIQPPKALSAQYLYYAFRTSNLGSLDKSTTIPSLSRDDFYAQSIPIAPRPEQNRIVEAIETQFTRLDAAVKALERAQIKLERYRASVLQAACEGRLVPTEAALARHVGGDRDHPYEPADQLLERILVERRRKWEEERWAYEIERAKKKAAQAERKAAGLPYYIRELEPEHWQDRAPEEYEKYLPKSDKWKEKYDEPEPPETEDLPVLPEGWCWASIDQISKVKGGKRLPKGHDYAEDETDWPYIRVTDFENFTINIEDLRYLPQNTHEQISRYTISKNDVYISIAGSIGKVGVVPDFLDNANLTENAAKISSLIGYKNTLLAYIFQAPIIRSQVKKYTTSSNQPKLALFRIKKIVIPLPPIAEQLRIAEELQVQFSIIDALEETVAANLTRAERMRQAILKKAFEGRLVEQLPEDEPASALLERIQKEPSTN